jgi:hypothetical protein
MFEKLKSRKSPICCTGPMSAFQLFELGLVRRSGMFQIETDGVLNGHVVFPEHVRMNIENIGCVYHPRRLVSKFQVL